MKTMSRFSSVGTSTCSGSYLSTQTRPPPKPAREKARNTHLEAIGVDLDLDQQSMIPPPRLAKQPFQMTGAFAEFERSMIRQRVWVGLSVRLRSSETANL